MKKVMLGIVLCVVLLVGGVGCEGGLTPEQVQALASHMEVLQQQVDTVQAAAAQMAEEMATAGIVDPNTVAKITKLNKEADRVQAQISVITQALKGVPLTGDAVQDFIAQLQAANAASAGFNPYVVPVGTVLTLLSIVLGWFVKRKAAEAKATKTALVETVEGGQKFKQFLKENDDASAGGAIKEMFAAGMDDKQSNETKKMVAVIKA